MSNAHRLLSARIYVARSTLTKFRLASTIVLLGYIACKGDTTVAPAVPTTIAANSATSLSGVAGSAVSPAPSIVVKDQNGAPMAGATVNFTVLSGGGSVSGASVATNESGIALVASWTLGTTAGPNSLSASVGSLAAVTFTATGTAGAAASLTKSAGDNQSGTEGSAAPIAPSVVVKDINGNVKVDVVVTFAVASGGGSVTGGTVTSDAAGAATVGSWILGAVGTNTLTASAPGVPDVTFTATAISSLCSVRTEHLFGSATSGALDTSDCRLSDGTFVDFFVTTLPEANAYLFRQSSAFDSYLYLGTPDGTTIGENDDEVSDANNTNSAIKALLPPGNYVIGASSFDAATTGDYSITSSTTSTDAVKCEVVFIVKNVSTSQNIEATDCLIGQAPNTSYGDVFFIFLKAGQSVTISMSSTAVDSFLNLVRLDGALVGSNDNKDNTGTKDAVLVYTAATTNYYAIFTGTKGQPQTGAYTLQVQ